MENSKKGIRKYKRANLKTRVNCFERGTFFSDYSSNISEGGLCMHSIENIESGTEITLQFSIPSISQAIKTKGEVKWSRTGYNSGSQELVNIGIEFKGIDSEYRKLIGSFVEKEVLNSN